MGKRKFWKYRGTTIATIKEWLDKKEEKSWLYKGTLLATVLTLIGIWSHLSVSFSVYELKAEDVGIFDLSFSGMVLASAISLFLIFTAFGITKIEKKLESEEFSPHDYKIIKKAIKEKTKTSKVITGKFKQFLLYKNLIFLNRSLLFFASIEMYGNAYYSIAVYLSKPKFTFDEMTKIDPVAWFSILVFALTLTIISIVGSKLISIFATDNENKELLKVEDIAEKTGSSQPPSIKIPLDHKENEPYFKK